MIDILIKNGFLITMRGPGLGIVEHGNVAIDGSNIVAVGKIHELKEFRNADIIIDASNQIVMPGLINAHIHAPASLWRGVAQDVKDWLTNCILPLKAHLKPQDAYFGSSLSALEALKSGTTCICEIYEYADQSARAFQDIGIRANVSYEINEIDPEKIQNLKSNELYPLDMDIGERKLEKNVELIEQWHNKADGRITCSLGPQAPDMLSRELLLKIKRISQDRKLMIHTHISQGQRENIQMIRRYKTRSVPLLDNIGFLGPNVMGVHLTNATDDEISLLVARGVRMVHCPTSIGIIDGIVSPLISFLKHGGKAALGTDQASSNHTNNMFNEMKFCAILNKIKAEDPRAMPTWKVLRLATIEGADAIGMSEKIGSIEKGKLADIIIIDPKNVGLSPILRKPLRNIISNLVYAAKGPEVHTVIVNGKIVMDEGQITTVDENEVLKEAQERAEDLIERAYPDLYRCKTLNMMRKGLL